MGPNHKNLGNQRLITPPQHTGPKMEQDHTKLWLPGNRQFILPLQHTGPKMGRDHKKSSFWETNFSSHGGSEQEEDHKIIWLLGNQ